MNALADKKCEWKTELKLWVQAQDGKGGGGRDMERRKPGDRMCVCL